MKQFFLWLVLSVIMAAQAARAGTAEMAPDPEFDEILSLDLTELTVTSVSKRMQKLTDAAAVTDLRVGAFRWRTCSTMCWLPPLCSESLAMTMTSSIVAWRRWIKYSPALRSDPDGSADARDGIEATRRIRQMEKTRHEKHTPIIAMTSPRRSANSWKHRKA